MVDSFCALDENGFLWSIGIKYCEIKLTNMSQNIRFISFRFIDHFVLALDEENYLWYCGDSQFIKSETLIKLSSRQIKDYDCSCDHVIAIDMESQLWGCGYNVHGELGIGDADGFCELTQLNRFKQNCDLVSCGCGFTAVCDSNGDVWTCGDNFLGQLGRHDNQDGISNFIFKKVDGINNSKVKSMLSDTFLVVTGENNKIWSSLQKKEIMEDMSLQSMKYKTIRHCNDSIMCIDTEGNLWGCGYDVNHILGLQTQNKNMYHLTQININAKFTDVSLSMLCSLALDVDGNIWTCGLNHYGQLGIGNYENTCVFKKIVTDHPITFISIKAYYHFNVALDIDGNIWICGSLGPADGCFNHTTFTKIKSNTKFANINGFQPKICTIKSATF